MIDQTSLSLYGESDEVSNLSLAFVHAQRELSRHVKNKDNYRAIQYRVFNGAIINNNFVGQNQRRSYFVNCIFDRASFNSSGFSGSYFVNCEFINCPLNHAIFDSCYFKECKIHYDEITTSVAVSFCGATFVDTEFINCHFQSSSLTSINCKEVSFNKCFLDGIIWENAKFTNTCFNSVRLKNLNLEFVLFEDVRFIKTYLPFASIPFAFKCLEHLIHSDDEVRIKSRTDENGIDKDTYLNLIPDLITFYRHTNNYFPLANLLISINRMDEAFVEIKKGISFLVKIHEYRTIKYFSMLMKISDFSNRQRSEAFEMINTELNKQFMSMSDIYNANSYLYEIRDNLLNSREQPYVTFEIYTSIHDNSENKFNIFLNSIEELASLFSTESNHFVEFRHNSPYQVLFTMFSSHENILLFISVMYLAYKGINKFFNDIIDVRIKLSAMEKAGLDNAKSKIELENMKFNLEERRRPFVEGICEEHILKAKEKSESIYHQMNAENINIGTINHNTFNINVHNLDSTFQQYSSE